MSEASDPKDVLRRFFATLSTGDYEAIGEFFGDDSVWTVNHIEAGFPAGRGRDGIINDSRPAAGQDATDPRTAEQLRKMSHEA
jgi:ketosteroid isomerase-like protein